VPFAIADMEKSTQPGVAGLQHPNETNTGHPIWGNQYGTTGFGMMGKGVRKSRAEKK
jgi:hypothetical protein